jgi:hypothetical protein
MSEFEICRVHPLLEDARINCTFDDILAMNDAEFVAYVAEMREAFLRYWDTEGLPPRRGWTYSEIDEEFGKLSGYDVQKFWKQDELIESRRVIQNTSTDGNAVNAWFASWMYQTRINYNEKDEGKSIYDFFKRVDLFERYLPYARRHFLRDSFYLFAQSVLTGSALPHHPEMVPQSGYDYVVAFDKHERIYGEYELLIEPVLAEKSGDYSGYGGKLQQNKPLRLTFDEYTDIRDHLLPMSASRNVQEKHLNDTYVFHLRQYKKGERLFPALFRSFRISMCQYAVNFPPLTAKLLYETFLSHVTTPVVHIYDPSCGWGGRILGAMSYNRQLPNGQMQHLCYYGTDPNPAFYKNGTSTYAVVADHYNAVRVGQSLFDVPHEYTVYQLGSELFHTTDAFQRNQGKGDLVFTSPPYFNREAYSEDENQSYKKFSSYDVWRDEFLRPTLKNAYDFLNHERYLLWNIADLKMGKNYLPLEEDSKKIAHDLGFVYKETVLMALASMPGANRVNEDGTATAKNFCKVNGRILKYEPVHVFWKP